MTKYWDLRVFLSMVTIGENDKIEDDLRKAIHVSYNTYHLALGTLKSSHV